MISNDKVAEFVLVRVQDLVRLPGTENDALARFNGNRRVRPADAASTFKEDVHLPLSEVGVKWKVSRTRR